MFSSIETYKPNIKKTTSMILKSHKLALSRTKEGMITFRALPPSDTACFNALNLLAYDYETCEGREVYVDDCLLGLKRMIEFRKEVDDNFIPYISPMLGIGDYSAFVAGDIYFSSDTSWSKPVLSDINGWRELPKPGESPWYGRFLNICELMLQKTQGSGIPFMRGFYSPLDLAAMLRGNDIYCDFYDTPELLHDLLDFCAEYTCTFAHDLYRLIKKYMGNTEYGMFYTDGINMSEDIACMISPDLYREFCAPHTQRVIDEFGKGYMHCHSRAMYLVKEICSLNKVATLWLATDPNQPRPMDHVAQIAEDAQGVSVAIDTDSFEEIVANKNALLRGNFSITLPVKDIHASCACTDRFKRVMHS